MGRQAAMTKLSSNVCVRRVRVRGGNSKFRALRLDTGNWSWGSEASTAVQCSVVQRDLGAAQPSQPACSTQSAA